jgi:hypothetical protein
MRGLAIYMHTSNLSLLQWHDASPKFQLASDQIPSFYNLGEILEIMIK